MNLMKNKFFSGLVGVVTLIAGLFLITCTGGYIDPSQRDYNRAGGAENPKVGKFYLDSDNNPTTEVTDTTGLVYTGADQKSFHCDGFVIRY
jgi:hypothetical protein